MIVSFMAIFDWRSTLLLCVAVALSQDIARKLSPAQPVYFVIFVGVIFMAGFLGAWKSGVKLSPGAIYGWKQQLKTPATLLVLLLVVQSMHTVARWDSVVLPAVGLIFYVAPVVAIVFAHQLAVRVGTQGIRKFLWFYVAASLVWFVSIWLESRGVVSPVLGEVGVGQMIYSFGLNRRAASGFFRSAEVAAWHVATVSCCLFILLNGRRLSFFKSLGVAAIVVFLVFIGFYTGRRKMLVYVVVFGGTYITLFAWFLRGKARYAAVAMLACVAMFGAALTLGPDAGERSFDATNDYLARRDVDAAWFERGMSVFADIPGRFELLAYKPIAWAVDGFGWFGAGLGSGAQGAQHFGGGAERFGGAGEGGLGKITMDLGLPGVALFLWVLAAVAQQIWRRLGALARASRSHATLAFGLAGILIANVASFAVATQIYGDVFVLLILGWSIGFLLALPAVAFNELRAASVPTSAMPTSPAVPLPSSDSDAAPLATGDGATEPLVVARRDAG